MTERTTLNAATSTGILRGRRNTGSLATSSQDGRCASHHNFIATATGSLSGAPRGTSEKIAAEMTADGGTLQGTIRTGMTTSGSPATSGTLGSSAMCSKKKKMTVPTTSS